MSGDLLDVAFAAIKEAADEIRDRVAQMTDIDLIKALGDLVKETPPPSKKRAPRKTKDAKPAKRATKKREVAKGVTRPTGARTSPRQDAIFAELRTSPGTVAELSKRSGLDSKTTNNALQNLKLNGLAWPPKKRGGAWTCR